MNLPPSFWNVVASLSAYTFLVLLQVLWWFDNRQLRMHTAESIRAHGMALRELTRREAGTRLPPR